MIVVSLNAQISENKNKTLKKKWTIPVTGAAENKPGNNKYLRCELFRFRFSSLSIKQVCAQLFNKYPALWGNDFNLRDLQGNGDRVEYRIGEIMLFCKRVSCMITKVIWYLCTTYVFYCGAFWIDFAWTYPEKS